MGMRATGRGAVRSRRGGIVGSGLLAGLLLFGGACAADSLTGIEDDGAGSEPGPGQDITPILAHFAASVEITVANGQVVLRSDGVPDHESPYFSNGDSRWTAYDGSNGNFRLNPNRIAEQQFVVRIPSEAAEATVHSATPLGAIGIAVNGVAIFNQYAGPSRPLTFEIDSFDQYNGHPQQTGVYHYHVEPLHLTLDSGDALVGVLLGGFPVYGPMEGGAVVSNSDLDEFHGHLGVTADFPDGIYHYHVTAQDPYINGSGFYGTPGSVSG
jgi:hypothetical protein